MVIHQDSDMSTLSSSKEMETQPNSDPDTDDKCSTEILEDLDDDVKDPTYELETDSDSDEQNIVEVFVQDIQTDHE